VWICPQASSLKKNSIKKIKEWKRLKRLPFIIEINKQTKNNNNKTKII